MTMMALIFFFIAAAIGAWSLMPDMSQRMIRQRIYAEVSAERKPTWLERATNLLGPMNQFLPLNGYTAGATKLLEAAAVRIPPLQFLVLQELCAAIGAALYLLIFSAEMNLVWLALFMAIGFFVPRFWVKNVQKSRRLAVTRDLPSVVDLLNLSVGAGSDFITALGRIVRDFRPCPVREELSIVLQEIRMGKRRRDALKAFSDRVKTPEVRAFTRTLIQVDRMGKGLTEALEVLAEDMNLARYHWAERFAQQAPVKMLLPLVFSLGAALIIVAGPILVQFFRGGFMSPGTLNQTH